ncbi:MAG TPA: hypothetical protein PKB10_06765, partial [Tepidisphaeraceae bacterium]|nr:hypothetical protein [Tepidisphaeraceae bacterium]
NACAIASVASEMRACQDLDSLLIPRILTAPERLATRPTSLYPGDMRFGKTTSSHRRLAPAGSWLIVADMITPV